MRLYIIVLIFLITLTACSTKRENITILTPEKKCTIVLDLGPFENAEQAVAAAGEIDWFDKDPLPDVYSTTALAAFELAEYFEKMSDIAVPVVDDDMYVDGPVIFLGFPGQHSAFSIISKKLKNLAKRGGKSDQGYYYETFVTDEQPFLLLCGRQPQGTLHAVYQLLQEMGVHWFEAGKNGEFIPKTKTIEVPGAAQYFEPLMQYRGYVFKQKRDEIFNADLVEWLGHNCINSFPYDERILHLCKQRGILTCFGGSDQFPAPLDPSAPFPYNHPSFRGDEEKPDCPYPLSPAFLGDKNNDGRLTWREVYPDWYGTQSTSTGRPVSSFCLAREYALEELAKNIVQQLNDGKIKADIYDLFFPDDLTWCMCNECTAIGSHQDKALYLHHFLHDAVNGKLDHNVKLYTHVSWQMLQNPAHKGPVERQDIPGAIVVKTSGRCYTHSISDTNCTEVNLAIYQQLAEITRRIRPVHIEEVYNGPGINDLPVIFTKIIDEDISTYADLGYTGMSYSYAGIHKPGVFNLLNYQLATGSWEPTRLDSLTREYFTHYYLNVAEHLKSFYTQMEECMSNISAWKLELADRINDHILYNDPAPVLPLERFRHHFNIQESFHEKNAGVDWEKTNQLIYEMHFSLVDAMNKTIPDRVRRRIIRLEQQRKYAELTIQLYDNVLRILTLEESEPEMKQEAQLRLSSLARDLRQFKIFTSALGETNGLTASGIEESVEHLVRYPR